MGYDEVIRELETDISGMILKYLSAINAELIHSHDDVFLAKQLLTKVLAKCYLKGERELPTNTPDERADSDYNYKYFAFRDVCEDAQRDMLAQGWRNVIIIDK